MIWNSVGQRPLQDDSNDRLPKNNVFQQPIKSSCSRNSALNDDCFPVTPRQVRIPISIPGQHSLL